MPARQHLVNHKPPLSNPPHLQIISSPASAAAVQPCLQHNSFLRPPDQRSSLNGSQYIHSPPEVVLKLNNFSLSKPATKDGEISCQNRGQIKSLTARSRERNYLFELENCFPRWREISSRGLSQICRNRSPLMDMSSRFSSRAVFSVNQLGKLPFRATLHLLRSPIFGPVMSMHPAARCYCACLISFCCTRNMPRRLLIRKRSIEAEKETLIRLRARVSSALRASETGIDARPSKSAIIERKNHFSDEKRGARGGEGTQSTMNSSRMAC